MTDQIPREGTRRKCHSRGTRVKGAQRAGIESPIIEIDSPIRPSELTRYRLMHDRNTNPTRAIGRALAALILTAIVPAQARTPQEIFEIAAPSIVVVEVLSAQGKLEGYGSGVVIAPGEVITNCHVAKAGKTLRVKHAKSRHAARLRHADHDRDLCQLSVPGLAAAPTKLGEVKNLKPGARVVAIGAPRGLELTISEGLISALRDFGDGAKIIQTTAPISPGSSGGGLFDEAGRLIGITTFYLAEGQNLNFALPVQWIAELPHRAAAPTKARVATLEWVARAIVLDQEGNLPGLLAHAHRWIAAEPGNSTAWFMLAFTYGKLGEHPKAIEAYQAALRVEPKRAGLWYFLGLTYGKIDEPLAAVKAYGEALRIDPKYADAWNNLGVAYGKLGQNSQASDAFRAELRNNPEHVAAWTNLGSSYALDNQFPQSLEALRTALRIDPKYAAAWYKLALTHALQGNRQEVIEAYQILRTLDPAMANDLFDRAIAPR